MNIFTQKDTLDEVISEVLLEMKHEDPASDRYTAMAKNLETLCKARSSKRTKLPSGDAIMATAANLGGLALILSYEKLGVISTKAFSLLVRTKI